MDNTSFISVAFYCIFYIFLAVRQKSYEMVSSLVISGAYVEQVCLSNWTATHEAAKVNSAALILVIARENQA